MDTNVFVNDSNWHLVAVTWDSATGAVEVFVDGSSVFTGTLSTGHTIVGSGSFAVGNHQDGVGTFGTPGDELNGNIDEVMLFDRVLSLAEIQSLLLLFNIPPNAVDDIVDVIYPDTEILADVLANDSDSNGDTIFLDSFDSVSEFGGTVAKERTH